MSTPATHLTTRPATTLAPSPRVRDPRRPSERHPWLFPWAVRAHRARRRVAWLLSGAVWAHDRETEDLPVRVKKHGSLLLRELSPAEMRLQRNKVVNLRLASARVDGLLIRPGETFSFNKVVGSCTRRKGYVEGMRLSNGEAVPGVGGGICQLANLLHWMFLHSPLTVVERSEHSFDPFPDKGRVLPWGVGCSIVYNYVDLVVRNDTAATLQLRVRVGERHLRGELRADRRPAETYRVEARDERFWRHEGRVFRQNEIWRTRIDRRTGAVLGEELVKRNCALVKYAPPEELIVDTEGPAQGSSRPSGRPAPVSPGHPAR
ncbi:VanW family protein [Nocardioides panaciterrulae]|uniref:Vancomycin resistance protein VanW n=1 Tax=Nocardioides panaciterrulae TaxID=661492 RepID=A0A7Y9JBQ1_9ACTN|nr:VanW family protein [Nocardioides panaciterrulae]NYD42426.1 vancomycin resistance protein VanW [Nocardioides panaciterrulae]